MYSYVCISFFFYFFSGNIRVYVLKSLIWHATKHYVAHRIDFEAEYNLDKWATRNPVRKIYSICECYRYNILLYIYE